MATPLPAPANRLAIAAESAIAAIVGTSYLD
jgi:hypothetical protein